MLLPIFHPLLSDSSTYLTFSKSLLDLDRAKQNNTPYFYSKMVALNLPEYKTPDFFIDLNSVGVVTDNPNTTIPKGMQFYMENIIRQSTGTENITELAFYKFLHYCGISYNDIQSRITFINKIATSNFTTVENNNGWAEIVGIIPNRCYKLTPAFKNIDIADIITSTPENNSDTCIFDNGNKEFLFNQDVKQKQVIDFENVINDEEILEESFDFNVLLYFYRDVDGIDKLHGINFINPFEDKITQFVLPKFTQKTNDARSIGYQFKLNLKTVNNEATKIIVEEYNNSPAHWNTYNQTLSTLNSFLVLNGAGSLINP